MKLPRPLSDLLTLTKYTLAIDQEPPRIDPPVASYKGTFTAEQREIAKGIYDESVTRRETIDGKAARLLSLVTFLVPVTASVSLYTISTAVGDCALVAVRVAALASIMFALLAFHATFRAGRVQEFFGLGRNALVDENSRVREYASGVDDYRARGYLWCGLANGEVNDRIATFTRAAELFVWVSVALLCLAAFAAFCGVRSKESQPQVTTGTVAGAPMSSSVLHELRCGMEEWRALLELSVADVFAKAPTKVDYERVDRRIQELTQRLDDWVKPSSKESNAATQD